MKIHGVVQLEVTTDTATGKPALIIEFPGGHKEGITTNIAEMIGGAGKGLRERYEQQPVHEGHREMTDIVERLRARIEKWAPNDPEYGRYTVPPPAIQIEAADEIERLRRHIADLRELREFDRKEIERLRNG